MKFIFSSKKQKFLLFFLSYGKIFKTFFMMKAMIDKYIHNIRSELDILYEKKMNER